MSTESQGGKNDHAKGQDSIQRADADGMQSLAALANHVAQTPGMQVSVNALFQQQIPGEAWTSANLKGVIEGLKAEGERRDQAVLVFHRYQQQRFWAELVSILLILAAGIALAVYGFDWGLTIVTAAASFYFGFQAGRMRGS